MKTRLQSLLATTRAICMAGFLCTFTACSPPKPDYEILITTPEAGTKLSGPLAISGKYAGTGSSNTGVRVELVRLSDNLSWNGSSWGPTFTLSTTRDTMDKTWQCSSPLPSGGDLQDGFFLISAYADFTNHAPERADSIFSVGVTPPPALPALYGWGHNLSGQLGSGVFDVAVHPVPVFTRGVLDGKIIASVAAGASHTLALTSEGRVYVWGSNGQSRLGLGAGAQPSEADFPAVVDVSGVLAGKKIVAIAAGSNHSLAVDKDGVVYAWGNNTSGELGGGSTGGDTSQPQVVGGLLTGKKVSQVAAGLSASLALTEDGEVFSWGRNDSGQLGNGTVIGDFVHSNTPVAVTGLAGKFISAIAMSEGHVLAHTNDGKVYAWGDNQGHQLGNSSGVDSNVPVLIGGILTGKTVTAIATGRYHSLAIAGGKVYAWGTADGGQLGTNTQIEHLGVPGDPGTWTSYPIELGDALTGKTIVRIDAGIDNSYAISDQNEVFGWGSNLFGGLPGFTGVAAFLPTLTDFGSVLTGGRVFLGFAFGDRHGMVLSGFPITPQPEIVVEAQGVELADGATINCGTFGVGTSNPVVITIRNSGGPNLADLTGLSVSLSDSNFHATFSQPSLGPNDETSFVVFFAPTTTGPLTTTLQVLSSDADESPFDITLTGTATPMGKVDLAFDPGVLGDVNNMSVQPDGKVVIGGSFVRVNGPAGPDRKYAARVDGTTGVADSFDPVLSDFSFNNCSLVLPDGKVMIGGAFTTIGSPPVARNRLARLNPDGTLDAGFDAQIPFSGTVHAMALQGDGKVMVTGNFSNIGGSGRQFLARLNTDGTVDNTFAPVLNSSGRGVVVQPDGNVVVCGAFTTAHGQGFARLARLSGTDGALDPGFINPNIVTKSSTNIECVAIQPNGKILVGGNLQSVNGTTRNGMCRLNADGTLDTSFDPDVNGRVTSIVVQASGRILIGGEFTQVGGQTRNRMAMLGANGALDQYFDPNPNSAVRGLALQADGRILAGGAFASIGGESRSNLARLSNDVATQTLWVDNGRIEWLRGGSSPETNLVTFDVSSDGGATWTPVGTGTRLGSSTPGWQLTGATLPATGHIRARAYPQGGYYNGSVSLLETTAVYGTPPNIALTENSAPVLYGSTRQFGVVATGTAASVMQLTIQNTGGSTLEGLFGASLDDDLAVTGDHRSQFQLVRPAANSLAPGASTTMAVIYRPKTSSVRSPSNPDGRHAAILRIPSNDADENPFAIFITGQGSLPFTTHKQFATGDSATADTAPSGLSSGQNLLSAYATGTTDASTDGDGTSITPPAGGVPFAPNLNGAAPESTFIFNYRRNKLALADVVFQVEWSDTLAPNDWHTDDVTEEILSDDDSIQQVKATVPCGTAGRRFVRLKMTRP